MMEDAPDFGALARGMRRVADAARVIEEHRAPAPKGGMVEKCSATDVWAVVLNPAVENKKESK